MLIGSYSQLAEKPYSRFLFKKKMATSNISQHELTPDHRKPKTKTFVLNILASKEVEICTPMKKAYKQRVQFGSAALDHLNQILQLHHHRTQYTPAFHHKSKLHLILGQVETLEETTIGTKIKKNIRNQNLAE